MSVGRAGTDADDGDFQFVANLCVECSRYFLHHQGEAAHFLERFCVAEELVGLGLFAGANGVRAKLVDTLRCESEMSHHGNTGFEDLANGVDDFDSSFQFQRVGSGFLHDANGVAHTFCGIHLVGTERHVAHHERSLHCAYD